MAGDPPTAEPGGGRRRYRLPDHVVHRSFEQRTVLLNLRSGQYHGLNPTAARMLEELERHGDGEAAAQTVADEYGQPVEQVRRDLESLCSQLVERDLLELDATAER